MDFSLFFNPVFVPEIYRQNPEKLGSRIHCVHHKAPEISRAGLVLIGCEKDDKTGFETADYIRNQLWNLSLPAEQIQITDLGNLIPKENKEETAEILGYITEKLLDAGNIVLLIGSSREITYGQSLGYRYNHNILEEKEEDKVEYVYISSSIDMVDEEIAKDENSINFRIFDRFPPTIHGFTGIGAQRYRLTQAEIHLMENLNFPILRYGDIAEDLMSTEPYIRDAKAVCLDMSAVRHGESPGSKRPSPGGFTVMEICKLARFAGTSSGVNTFSVTELDIQEDIHEQTTMLAAMILWYFCEGYYARILENPALYPINFRTYKVKTNTPAGEIIFYQSNLTGRWWMEVKNTEYKKVVSCTEKAYLCVTNNELPERWWQVFNRLA